VNTPGLGVGLKAFLANAPADIASVLCALAEASLSVAHLIRRGSLGGALDAAVGPAHDGIAQKALDVFADKSFVDGLKGSGVRGVVSEERDDPVAIDRTGTLLVAIDPLDGSSNIDANVTIGSVFSVLDAPAGEVEGSQFLQRGVRQRAAGLVVYGPHVAFVFWASVQIELVVQVAVRTERRRWRIGREIKLALIKPGPVAESRTEVKQ